MKYFSKLHFSFIFSVIGLFFFTASHAQEYSLSADKLGLLKLELQSVQAVNNYSGHELSAHVAGLSGQSYNITSPFNAWRIEFMKLPGQYLKKGEPFVSLMGPEAHHYHEQYELKKTLFAQTERHFQNNRTLFEKKAIGEQAWLDINSQYVALKLEMGEYTHFFDYVHSFDETQDAFILKAPSDGMLRYSDINEVVAGQQISTIVPRDAIRLFINVPIGHSAKPVAVSTQKCTLAIDFAEAIAHQFYRRLWSEPLKESCQISFGETVSVVPKFDTTGFLVAKTALFDFEGSSYIWIKKADAFVAIKIEVLASNAHNLVISTEQDITGVKVLVSSVSALQGMLIGLGE